MRSPGSVTTFLKSRSKRLVREVLVDKASDMATHRDSVEIVLASSEEATREKVHAFLEANGYERVREEPLVYERGEQGAGWWSSEMSKLYAKYMIRHDDERLVAALDVDTTGQHMTQEDLAFWRRELEALRDFATSEQEEVGPAPDLRVEERARAKSGRRETWRLSVYGFTVTFVLLFIIVLMLQRLGMLTL